MPDTTRKRLLNIRQFFLTFILSGYIELRALGNNSNAQAFYSATALQDAHEFVKKHADRNLYFGVAERGLKKNGKLENCTFALACWVDIDFKDTPEAEARQLLSDFAIPPSAIIHSGGGLHLYWLLKSPFDLKTRHPEFKALLRRIAIALKADLNAAECARILRVPGTKNYKYDPPRPVVIEQWSPGAKFDFSDFDFLPAETLAPVTEPTAVQCTAEQAVELAVAVLRCHYDKIASNGPWTDFGMALNDVAGSHDVVRDAFMELSARDPNYTAHAKLNRTRWNSFKAGKPGNKGAGTLIRIFNEHGVEPPSWLRGDSAQEDMKNAPPGETAVRIYRQNNIPANLDNAVAFLEADREFCNVWYDSFLQRVLTSGPDGKSREWTDTDNVHLMLSFQRLKGMPRMSETTAAQAIIAVATRNKRNCAQDWLDALEWDGQPRIEQFFQKHFGADDSEYVSAVGRNFFLSIVARVYEPGCQCDYMIVLEGNQGIGKSAALRAIGGEWFCEQHESVTKKDFYENLQGKLLVEIAEMDSFTRGEITKVKSVITSTSDRYRESYGRKSSDHPRQCVFAGTTNSDSWNNDVTGARRFWPITCKGQINIKAIRTNRDQCFAEATVRYLCGESWWSLPLEATSAEQARRYVEPAWTESIRNYISDYSIEGQSVPCRELSIHEVLKGALNLPEAQWTKGTEMRVAECLKFLNWEKRKVRRGQGTVQRWFRPEVGTHA